VGRRPGESAAVDAAAKHVVVIAKELEELIPAFLENRRRDAEALKTLLLSDDFEGLRLLGDRIKGVSGSYGFVRTAAIAKTIEDKARQANRAALYVLVEEYARHVEAIEIVFKEQ
jgi:HPt (histidine-containing phosphotransfer) domain-containing protein